VDSNDGDNDMKTRFLHLFWLLVPLSLFITGLDFAGSDNQPKPLMSTISGNRQIKVTGERAVISSEGLYSVYPAADSGDSIFGGQVVWEAFSPCAIACSSATYTTSGSLGEVVAGECSSSTYGVTQELMLILDGSCCNIAGDAGNDGAVNVGDAVYLINYIFKGGPAPACLAEGDAQGDCQVNVGDAVYLINYVFKGGDPPICNDECTWP